MAGEGEGVPGRVYSRGACPVPGKNYVYTPEKSTDCFLNCYSVSWFASGDMLTFLGISAKLHTKHLSAIPLTLKPKP